MFVRFMTLGILTLSTGWSTLALATPPLACQSSEFEIGSARGCTFTLELQRPSNATFHVPNAYPCSIEMPEDLATLMRTYQRRVIVRARQGAGPAKIVWSESLLTKPGALQGTRFQARQRTVRLGGLRLWVAKDCSLSRPKGQLLPKKRRYSVSALRADLKKIDRELSNQHEDIYDHCVYTSSSFDASSLSKEMTRALRNVRAGRTYKAIARLHRDMNATTGGCENERLECYADTGRQEHLVQNGARRRFALLEAMWARFGRDIPNTHPDRRVLESAWWDWSASILETTWDEEELEPASLLRARALQAQWKRLKERPQPIGLLTNPALERRRLQTLFKSGHLALIRGRMSGQAERAQKARSLDAWRAAVEEHVIPLAHEHALALAKRSRCEAAAFGSDLILSPAFGPELEVSASHPRAIALANDVAYWWEGCADTLSLNRGRAARWLRHIIEKQPERAAAHLNLADLLRSDTTASVERTVRYAEYVMRRQRAGARVARRATAHYGVRLHRRLQRQLDRALPTLPKTLRWPPPPQADTNTLERIHMILLGVRASHDRMKLAMPTPLASLHIDLMRRLAARAARADELGWAMTSQTLWSKHEAWRAALPIDLQKTTAPTQRRARLTNAPRCEGLFYKEGAP